MLCRRVESGQSAATSKAVPESAAIVWPGFPLADYAPPSPRSEMAIGLTYRRWTNEWVPVGNA